MQLGSTLHYQGVVTPIGTVVTAKTGVKQWSTRQGFAIGQGVKDNLRNLVLQSNGQESFCICRFWHGQTLFTVVKRSSSKNDGQNFLTPVLVVTTVHMGVPTP